MVLLCLPACKADTDSGGSGIPKNEAPETFAKELCAAYYECQCDDDLNNSPFTSQENCEAEIEAAIQADVDRADEADLFYDSTCARDALDFFEGLGCTALGDLSLAELSEVTGGIGCKAFYGTDEVGEACESINNDDTCVQGATCEQGTCAAIDALPEPGEACSPAFSLCAEGALCIDIEGGTNNTCEILPDIGETCLGTADICALGLACDQAEKTCALAPGDGEACAPPAISQCGDDLYCDTDTCAPQPTGGEACMPFPGPGCGEGFTCTNNTCVVEPAIICTYTLGAL